MKVKSGNKNAATNVPIVAKPTILHMKDANNEP